MASLRHQTDRREVVLPVCRAVGEILSMLGDGDSVPERVAVTAGDGAGDGDGDDGGGVGAGAGAGGAGAAGRASGAGGVGCGEHDPEPSVAHLLAGLWRLKPGDVADEEVLNALLYVAGNPANARELQALGVADFVFETMRHEAVMGNAALVSLLFSILSRSDLELQGLGDDYDDDDDDCGDDGAGAAHAGAHH